MPSETSPTSFHESSLPPSLAALFLIQFDLKVGYKITWKRHVSNIELDGAVEFKSLPSGLHNVKEDLVYFIHDGYAGVSTFISAPAPESQRNSHFVAVGVLVPLLHGKLGRVWLHAPYLRHLASMLVTDSNETGPLADYWDEYCLERKSHSRTVSPVSIQFPLPSDSVAPELNSKYRARTLSSTAGGHLGQSLHPYHPAFSFVNFMRTFGPLVFPLHRAALLRKRILIISKPPIKSSCEFVYDLSILSSLSSSTAETLASTTEPIHRMRAFFAIGVHDILFLEKDAHSASGESLDNCDSHTASPRQRGWIACTTDEILLTKTHLYDIVIELPATHSHEPNQGQWPQVKDSCGSKIRATQRDFRRYRILHKQLSQLHEDEPPYSVHEQYEDDDHESMDDHTALISDQSCVADSNRNNDDISVYEDGLLEPMTWSALAYSGFMWWASAGEKDASIAEEELQDRELQGDISNSDSIDNLSASQCSEFPRAVLTPCTALIAYFRRLTCLMLRILEETIDAANEEDGVVDNKERTVMLDSEDLGAMGLDVWSERDKEFAIEALNLYFGRDGDVRGIGVRCCGVRVF